MIYPIVSYRAIPEPHTYLPCRPDTEDSIHHLQKEASAVLHPAAIPICPPIGVIFGPLAATRSAIWQPKQVKQNSEGGKKWVCVLREPKLRNPNYSMFAKATILTIHFDQTLGA